jgi:hypothetical protein
MSNKRIEALIIEQLLHVTVMDEMCNGLSGL